MVARVVESDRGSKQRAISAGARVARRGAEVYQREFLHWLSKVVMLAKRYCPVDTGTLAKTIRIVTKAPTGVYFEVIRDPLQNKIDVTALITAGGWLVNPKTGRICDYAEAVHDGHVTRGGGYYFGVPFMTMAIDQCTPELDRLTAKLGKAWEQEWKRDY